jgi:hypothetical protein
MARVLAALEAYWESRGNWEGRPNGTKVEELLLYNLWKECRKWLKLKDDKPLERTNTELFMRRKLNVELLRDASMERLAGISANVAKALEAYGVRKENQGKLGMALQPLDRGYSQERAYYEQQGKQGGSSISWSYVQERMQSKIGETNMKKFRHKQHGDLTIQEALKISQLYPSDPVVFRNKIQRMRNLVTVSSSGIMSNLEGEPILMNGIFHGKYETAMYAMDKYGNLFIDKLGGNKDYVSYSKSDGYELKQTQTFNHSSFLAGADVLCAGCLHIGYNVKEQHLEAGVLSFIDNNSGHYKPTRENLQNAVIALRDQGVDIQYVMVADRSTRGVARCYWGPDFCDGFLSQWPDRDHPSGIVPAPPVDM